MKNNHYKKPVLLGLIIIPILFFILATIIGMFITFSKNGIIFDLIKY